MSKLWKGLGITSAVVLGGSSLFLVGGDTNNNPPASVPVIETTPVIETKSVPVIKTNTTNTRVYADRDCADFSSQREAQSFYESQGGPQYDRHDLDRDRDGIACESLK